MPNLSDSRIGQIAIVCTDVARARDFYRDALGLEHLFDAGPTLSFFQSGTTRLMLSTAEGEPTGTSVLYFFVPDIEATKKELVGKGVKFIDEPHMIAKMPDHELWLVAFRDSENNMLALMEERR
ncbi:MAG TPA: VOC family protein [Gemmatimonadaceae bacterium]|nr:VOC family protein [Gemmatimonadaceae bacterium]